MRGRSVEVAASKFCSLEILPPANIVVLRSITLLRYLVTMFDLPEAKRYIFVAELAICPDADDYL